MDAQKDKKPRMKNKAILEPSIRSRPARAIHVSTTVGIGNTVYLKSHGYDFKCTLVHPEDAEPDIGLISYDSFVGKKIIGKKVHDMVLITTPFGRFKYRITKIMKK